MLKKSSSLLFVFLFLVAHVIVFALGNFEALDREAYLRMFQLKYGAVESGFHAITVAFHYLGIPPVVGLYSVSLIMFLMAFFSTWRILEKSRGFYFVFAIIFFAATSLYTYIQLRSGFAAWVGVLFYSQFLLTKKWKWLIPIPFTGFFHVLMFPFGVLAILYHVLRVPFWLLWGGSFISTIGLIYFPEIIIEYTGYYKSGAWIYFTEERKNALFFSPFLWSYFLISISFFIFLTPEQMQKVKITFLGLPFAIIGFVTSFGIIPRFSVPFVILAWVFFFKYIILEKMSNLKPILFHGIGITFVLVSLAYGIVRNSGAL